MKIAVYAGSFDPVSNGHIDIITRAASLFDKLYVLVTKNIGKTQTFSLEERQEMIRKVIKLDNVIVDGTDDLVVRYAKKVNASIIVRGLRNVADFESEISLYHYNKYLDEEIETVALFPSHKLTYVSSSLIKELVYYDVDIKKYVPEVLVEQITQGIKKTFKK
ncbi:MAG TPA: pantetheine-phosphate adenylyltransferase [Acholeplasma sp.]|jgi:pantetheine-phosphate adenylyltransferase|nr:pantetheine-phosphate adenylyltransferase [Acholeplasma sp.]